MVIPAARREPRGPDREFASDRGGPPCTLHGFLSHSGFRSASDPTSQPHVTAIDRSAARYTCYAQRNGPGSGSSITCPLRLGAKNWTCEVIRARPQAVEVGCGDKTGAAAWASTPNPCKEQGPPPQRVYPGAWPQWQVRWCGHGHPRCEAGASRSDHDLTCFSRNERDDEPVRHRQPRDAPNRSGHRMKNPGWSTGF
jgi:hypothetical protein